MPCSIDHRQHDKLRRKVRILTSECKALWGEPDPAPFFVCAYAFALIDTRDAVHVRV